MAGDSAQAGRRKKKVRAGVLPIEHCIKRQPMAQINPKISPYEKL